MIDPAPLAAIDLGSNSFRLEIGHIRRGKYRRQDYWKRTVRLGAGLNEQRQLTEEAAQRGLACLEEFAQHLQAAEIPAERVRAVATQTLREAANRDEFLRRGQAALGHPIEVISGREEARLIYAGVSFLQASEARRLVIDIGGRSTELILGEQRQPLAAESFPVGSVSLSMRYFADGKLNAQAFKEAQIAASAQFEEALEEFHPRLWQEALGSSGTAGAVADILRACGKTDGSITPEGLAWLTDRCIQAGSVEALDLAGLKEDRRAVIPGGLAILSALSTHFGIRQMRPAKGALRQGVIVDLRERLMAAQSRRSVHSDMRDQTVAQLQIRFDVDIAQARRVRTLALSLWQSAAPQQSAQEQRELGWVCDLHEIGMAVSHHDHHRHSAYLLAHLDAAGFSQSQQRRLADLALAQRGGLRKVEALLADVGSLWMVLCLRLAVICCHARIDPGSPQLLLTFQGPSGASLGWKPSTSTPDSRMLHLLREEVEAWAKLGVFKLGWAS